jgi:hypothetical protein
MSAYCYNARAKRTSKAPLSLGASQDQHGTTRALES